MDGDSKAPEETHNIGKQWTYSFATVDEYLEAAENAGDEKQLEKSIEILREAVERFPDSAEAHYDLGVALFMLLESRLAHLDFWENLAEDEELAEEAVAAFEAAIERKPDFAPAYTNLGNMLALRGDARKAVNLWQRSLELEPNQPEVRDNLDRYLPLLGDNTDRG
ncbi:MAG: tetratricopeptide repeat protein [Candidatus Sumerlaeaceae bacterium]|nr:tetratricopeptide repeat protein [Candidatus Sumerlaeaceae bacterium]